MMNAQAILDELRSMGSESVKKTLLEHGAREPYLGVKIGDLKTVQKRVKKNHALALELYDSGISDAMYLAGLIVDDSRMTRADLQRWAEQAFWPLLSESTVAWVAAESPHGREAALEWIDSPEEKIASSGWSTLSCLVALQPDQDLDLDELKALLHRVATTIHDQPNRVRYCMNGFVISIGAYVEPLTDLAIETARAIGKVSVNMGKTACKVPAAEDSIAKIQARSAIGKKKKTVKC